MDSQKEQMSRPKSSDQDLACMDCVKPVSEQVLKKQLSPADIDQNKTKTTSSSGSGSNKPDSKILKQ